LASEILNARPYAFLDNAPLEERRTQAVYTRRASERNRSDGLGILDAAAIEKVQKEAWPRQQTRYELHDALMLLVATMQEEIARLSPPRETVPRNNGCGSSRQLARDTIPIVGKLLGSGGATSNVWS